MVRDKIQHQLEIVLMQPGAESCQPFLAAQRVGDPIISHGEGRALNVLRATVGQHIPVIPAQRNRARPGTGLPDLKQPKVREAKFLPIGELAIGDIGESQRRAKLLPQFAQPRPGVQAVD